MGPVCLCPASCHPPLWETPVGCGVRVGAYSVDRGAQEQKLGDYRCGVAALVGSGRKWVLMYRTGCILWAATVPEDASYAA